MNKLCLFSVLLIISIPVMAQDLPFSTLPPAPEEYTSGNSISRMIQGLGFRYYWATEGLRGEDLEYRPSEVAQSSLGTLQHIYRLSNTIFNAAKNEAAASVGQNPPETLQELRKETLVRLKKASDLFQQYKDKELEQIHIIFNREGTESKFPIWNLINGPIADALYHTGQVVSFRRTSGNPLPKGVNVFLGVKN
jgi:uncharacterized damage-inducible protein DinB